jgi:hypothetical protein
MQSKSRQRGMTFWGLLFVLGVIAVVMFLIFKLFPVYMGDFKVRSALDSLAKQQDIATMSKTDIAYSLEKRFDVDDIRHVNLKQDLTIEARGKGRVVRIQYAAVVPMVSNISALVEFDHSREVAGSGQ